MIKALQSDRGVGDRSRTSVRELGINANHWYAVAEAGEVGDKPLGTIVWHQPVCVFRDAGGLLHALEDRCPHRFVRISQGHVVGEGIECPYHGWRFAPDGRCVRVSGVESRSIPEGCHLKSYPVVEQDGFVWIFPGEAELSRSVRPMSMVEWDDLDFVRSSAKMSCRAHFSFVIENLMDMYHGHLHQKYQAWTVSALEEVVRGDGLVEAHYAATGYYRVDRYWSALQLMIPALRQPHRARLTVAYQYPHWKASLGEDFVLYGVFCPVGPRRTDLYLVHYTSIHRMQPLPRAPLVIRRAVKRCLNNIARKLLENLLSQDVPMVEEEQCAYDAAPERKPLELNRTVHAVQRLIRSEAERA